MNPLTEVYPEPAPGLHAADVRPPEEPIPAQPDRLANLVLQGGGSLGIAHVGAISYLESKGVRFVGLAGASAGAIAAMLIAASRRHVDQPCGETLRGLLGELPASDFVDGPASVRRLLKRVIPKPRFGIGELALVPGCWRAVRTLARRYGLNPGDAFHAWLEESMRTCFGVDTREDLESRIRETAKSAVEWMRRSTGESLEEHIPDEWTDPADYLALTATALPVGLRLILPRHIDVFDAGVRSRRPAEWVRASMSVPGFFEPVTWRLPEQRDEPLSELADFQQLLEPHEIRQIKELESLTLVDGGLLSNFPVDAFSAEFLPAGHPISRLPTVGLMLTPGERVRRPVRGLAAVGRGVAEMVSATRAIRDREARVRMRRRREVEELRALRDGLDSAHEGRLSTVMIAIDPGEHHWLDFSLSAGAMDDLYERGWRAAKAALGKSLDTNDMEGGSDVEALEG